MMLLVANAYKDPEKWPQGKDFKNSFTWYKKAAEQGRHVAMLQLARAYWRGEGTEKNYDIAKEWILKAKNSGANNGTVERALARLEKLKK